MSFAPSFTFISGRIENGGLAFPQNTVTNNGFFGPNLRVSASSTAVTPELPGVSLVLPALLPVALVAMRRRRNKANG